MRPKGSGVQEIRAESRFDSFPWRRAVTVSELLALGRYRNRRVCAHTDALLELPSLGGQG